MHNVTVAILISLRIVSHYKEINPIIPILINYFSQTDSNHIR